MEATATQAKTQTVSRYINATRNLAKRNYAWSVWHAMVRHEDLPEASGLSYMGAQAVRMALVNFDTNTGLAK